MLTQSVSRLLTDRTTPKNNGDASALRLCMDGLSIASNVCANVSTKLDVSRSRCDAVDINPNSPRIETRHRRKFSPNIGDNAEYKYVRIG